MARTVKCVAILIGSVCATAVIINIIYINLRRYNISENRPRLNDFEKMDKRASLYHITSIPKTTVYQKKLTSRQYPQQQQKEQTIPSEDRNVKDVTNLDGEQEKDTGAKIKESEVVSRRNKTLGTGKIQKSMVLDDKNGKESITLSNNKTIEKERRKWREQKLKNKSKVISTSECKERDVKLSNKPLPITGLMSLPGSGNTRTRHLLQQLTGIGSTSVYCGGFLLKGGFPFECTKKWNRTIAVESHRPKDIALFEKIILLIRNPYDAFLAFTNYFEAGLTDHSSRDALVKIINKNYEENVQLYSTLVKRVTAKFKGPVYVLHYEKLESNLKNELEKLAKFLNVKVTQHDIECTVKNQEGHFHRITDDTEHIGLLRFLYTKEQLTDLRHLARHSKQLFKEAYGIDIDVGAPVEKDLFVK